MAILWKAAAAGYRFSASAREQKERGEGREQGKKKKRKKETEWREEGATISGRRTSCTAYPRHRTSKVRARGNTRAEMPPMPRQRRTECVPAGRRPRGTSTMADEAASRGKLTFNIQPNPLQTRFVYDYESKFRRLEKKNFAKSFPKKFHVFFIYNYTTTCQNIDHKSLEFLENERIHRSYDENVRSGTT